MAHAAELPAFPEKNDQDKDLPTVNSPTAVQNPISPSAVQPIAIDEWDESLTGESLYEDPTWLRRSLLDSFYESVSAAVDACAPYFQASAESVRTVGRKIKTLKEEKPLQFLGVIAGTAFALGMVIRLRRSRS